MRELTAEEIRRRCIPENLGFKTSADLQPQAAVVYGQDRARKALERALAMNGNAVVLGDEDLGRVTLTKRVAEEYMAVRPPPRDVLYVPNFADPRRPLLLQLPAGEGCKFAQAMRELALSLLSSLRSALTMKMAERQGQAIKLQGKLQKIMEGSGFRITKFTGDPSQPFEYTPEEEIPPEVREKIDPLLQRLKVLEETSGNIVQIALGDGTIEAAISQAVGKRRNGRRFVGGWGSRGRHSPPQETPAKCSAKEHKKDDKKNCSLHHLSPQKLSHCASLRFLTHRRFEKRPRVKMTSTSIPGIARS